MNVRTTKLVAAPLLTALASCNVGPDYVRPDVPTPDVWHQAITEGLAEGAASVQTWWTTLDDPLLEELIRRAARGNLDLRAAYARIMEGRALRGIAAGERWPDVDAFGDARRGRVSENVEPLPQGQTKNSYSLGLDAAWEIDVWGRIRRSVEAADASLEAEVENYRDVLVLLYAEVALSYVEARALQRRIGFAEANAEAQRRTLQLVRDRRQAELVPELDVQQADLSLAETESAVPVLRIGLAQALHRLAVLLGEHPGELHEELAAAAPVPAAPDTVAVGLPRDLLRQRPDVRRAERELAAQTARIGVATAELYPRFSLTGFFAFDAVSGNAADFFSGDSRSWSFGLPVRWNLFDGGRVRSNIEAEKARTQAALMRYQNTVLLALEDVENALVSYVEERRRRAFLERSVRAAQQSVALVESLYQNGLTDFQNVLDMQRSLFRQQDELAANEGRVVQNLVLLYRALGGGWDPGEEAAAGERP